MSNCHDLRLNRSLLEQVLQRFNLATDAPADLATLRTVYAAWCRQVPFDNVQKLIHMRVRPHRVLPGSNPEDFFTQWLKHGTGGTCWAGSTALFALLNSMEFDADRGISTMLAAPTLPPNHGTVRVNLDDASYLVDSAMLFGDPLPLVEGTETHVIHPAWGLRCVPSDHLWSIHWRPLHKTDGFECRMECFGATHEIFVQHYEGTLGWGPFNFEVNARLNRGDEVIGLAFGHAVTLTADGTVKSEPVDDDQRREMLIEDFGMSEEIIDLLPADIPTPPPPGSRTAASRQANA